MQWRSPYLGLVHECVHEGLIGFLEVQGEQGTPRKHGINHYAMNEGIVNYEN